MVNYLKVMLGATLLILLLLAVGAANARVDQLTVQRMILYGECELLGEAELGDAEIEPFTNFPLGTQGAGLDTRANPPRAQGSLTIETDASYIIRNMRFDAWFRGADQPILDDRVIILDYVPNGAWYEVMSLFDNEQYYITFIRRAPPNEGYDPAIIFAIRLFEDCVAQVDYRYAEPGF